MKRLFIVSIYFLCCFHVSAQLKNEQEKSIKEQQMPLQAIELLRPFTTTAKVRYIYETDGERSSFEAKFKHGGKQYSVEFDTSGNLEDVEVTINFKKSLPKRSQDQINKTLQEISRDFKIIKFQKQYRYHPPDPSNTISSAINDLKYEPIYYELEVDFNTKKRIESYEILCDSSGELVSKRKIVKRATDNILY